MTLLLGPPGSGKTTLLQGLAGKLGDDLRVCLLSYPRFFLNFSLFMCFLLTLIKSISFNMY